MVSIVLVLSPNRNDAMKLALNRIYANLVGAGTGLTLFYVHPTNIFTLATGVVAVVVVCRVLNLKEAARSERPWRWLLFCCTSRVNTFGM